jgi:hypothetical protein
MSFFLLLTLFVATCAGVDPLTTLYAPSTIFYYGIPSDPFILEVAEQATPVPYPVTLTISGYATFLNGQNTLTLSYSYGASRNSFVVLPSFAGGNGPTSVFSISFSGPTGLLSFAQQNFNGTIVQRSFDISTTAVGPLKPGQTSTPIQIRIGNNYPHVGNSITVTITATSPTITVSPTSISFGDGDMAHEFTVTQTSNPPVSGTSYVTVSFSDWRYAWSGVSPILVSLSGPTANLNFTVTTEIGSVVVPNTLQSGQVSLPPGITSVPWYMFLDSVDTQPGSSVWASSPTNYMQPIGQDSTFNPPAWSFGTTTNPAFYQSWTFSESYPSLQTPTIQAFPVYSFLNTPPPTITQWYAGYSWAFSLTVPFRNIFSNYPTDVFIGDTFYIAFHVSQQLPPGLSLQITVDSGSFDFFDASGNLQPFLTSSISSNSSLTGVAFKCKAKTNSPTANNYGSIFVSYSGPAVYLFGTSSTVLSVLVHGGSLTVQTPANYELYVGVPSSPLRITATVPPPSGLQVAPFSPHCSSSPAILNFGPGQSLEQYFSLTCNQTWESGAAPNQELEFFVSGPDRFIFGPPPTINLPIQRASIYVYFPNTTLYVMQPYTLSVYTNRAPDSSVTVSFSASPDTQLSNNGQVALTNAAPGNTLTLTPQVAASNLFLSWALSGSDSYLYRIPATTTLSSASVSTRPISFIRICTQAETALFGSCSTGNFVLNPPNVFLTYFNLTVPVSPLSSITVIPKNNNLVFSPSQITISAGQTSATFSITSTIATGTSNGHKITWAWAPATPQTDMLIHDLPPVSVVYQNEIGVPSVTFPTTSASSQIVSSIFLIVVALFSVLFF